MGAKIFVGERVKLTAIEPSDYPLITKWYQNEDFVRTYSLEVARPPSEAQVREELEERLKAKDEVVLGIRTIEDEKLLGLIDLSDINLHHRVAMVGLGIGEVEHQKKGVGKEAMQLLFRFAFYELNLHRLSFSTLAANKGVIVGAEQLGFVREGVQRQVVERDGVRHDLFLYGLLRHEWESLQSN